MVIRAAIGDLVELELAGLPSDLRAMAGEISLLQRDIEWSAPADLSADPAPYDRCLMALRIRTTGGLLRVTIDGDDLVVSGDLAATQYFADFLCFPDSARPGAHGHLEWFEGSKTIAPDSLPLVVGVR